MKLLQLVIMTILMHRTANEQNLFCRWTIDVGWTSAWVRIVNEWVATCVYSKYFFIRKPKAT